MAQLQEKAQRLRHLEQEILQRSQWLVQQIFLGDFAGREGDIASDTRELDALKSEFQALMDNTVLPEHFDLYGVTESVDYASGHWLKLSGEGGLELAGQAVSFKDAVSPVQNAFRASDGPYPLAGYLHRRARASG